MDSPPTRGDRDVAGGDLPSGKGCSPILVWAAIGLGLLGCLCPVSAFLYVHRPFSRARWRAMPASLREPMAKDYLETRDVTTLTIDDVKADLGEPYHFADVELEARGNRSRTVTAGWLINGPPADALFLEFEFDADGRVIRAMIDYPSETEEDIVVPRPLAPSAH